MAQIRQETDNYEPEREKEVIDLTNCVILSIEDYDTLKERLHKYETQFKELTADKRESEVDDMLSFVKIHALDENACRLALKNGIVLDDFVKEDCKDKWQSLADRFITSVDELKKQAYDLAMKHIELVLKIKETRREKGLEQPQ